jgi:hypothetical protein
MIGDQNDFVGRLKANLPQGWFPVESALSGTLSPVLTSILSGPAWSLSWIYALLGYTKDQTRMATATDVWLDIISQDFFGGMLQRYNNETDSHFLLRIQQNLLAPKNTRAAMIQVLEELTGNIPIIFEPKNTGDTGGYGGGEAKVWTNLAYDQAGGYGSVLLPFQAFITIARPVSQGIALVDGYGQGAGGYGQGAIEYVDDQIVSETVPDSAIYQAITNTAPEATIMWTKIVAPPAVNYTVIEMFLSDGLTPFEAYNSFSSFSLHLSDTISPTEVYNTPTYSEFLHDTIVPTESYTTGSFAQLSWNDVVSPIEQYAQNIYYISLLDNIVPTENYNITLLNLEIPGIGYFQIGISPIGGQVGLVWTDVITPTDGYFLNTHFASFLDNISPIETYKTTFILSEAVRDIISPAESYTSSGVGPTSLSDNITPVDFYSFGTPYVFSLTDNITPVESYTVGTGESPPGTFGNTIYASSTPGSPGSGITIQIISTAIYLNGTLWNNADPNTMELAYIDHTAFVENDANWFLINITTPFTYTFLSPNSSPLPTVLVNGSSYGGLTLAANSPAGTVIAAITVTTGLANGTVATGAYTWALSIVGDTTGYFQIVGNNLETAIANVPVGGPYEFYIDATNAAVVGSPFSLHAGVTVS